MSTQAMQLAIGLMKSGEFDGARLKVLMYLAWKHDWRSGFAWPAMATIATETGIEERSVRRVMHYLEERGVLRLTRGNGAGHLTRYEFPGLIVAEEKGDMISEKGGHSEPIRGTLATEKGDTGESAIRKEKQDQKQEQREISKTSSSKPDDDAGETPSPDFERVIRAFEESPVTTGKAKAVDLVTARALLRGFTPQQIENGILLGSARRASSGIDGEVQTLAYFENSIAEAAIDANCPESYAQYLRHVLTRWEQGKRRKTG